MRCWTLLLLLAAWEGRAEPPPSVQSRPQARSNRRRTSITTTPPPRWGADALAERDAQIASALLEVAQNQPHLHMMVQTLGEVSAGTQRLQLAMTRLEETQRLLTERIQTLGEKMSLLESRWTQSDRRFEREMGQLQHKMEDFLRSTNLADKSADGLAHKLGHVGAQLDVLQELLLENTNHVRVKSNSRTRKRLNRLPKTRAGSPSIMRRDLSSSDTASQLASGWSQTLGVAHSDIVRVVREAESHLVRKMSLLAEDNKILTCFLSKIFDSANNSSNISLDKPQSLSNDSTCHLRCA